MESTEVNEKETLLLGGFQSNGVHIMIEGQYKVHPLS